MARNDRIARLFQVLTELSHTRRGLPLRTLAERGGWRLRSVYRDIEALEKAGFPVEREDRRYRMMDGFVPPVPGSPVGEAVPVPAPFFLTPPPARERAARERLLATVERAVRDRLVLTAVHESPAGEVSERKIDPAQLLWDARLETLYLVGNCRLRKAVRCFAVHRLQAASCGRERAAAVSPEEANAAFRAWRARAATGIRLSFIRSGARQVARRLPHRIERRPDGAVLLEAESDNLEEPTGWIMGWGADCMVLAPAVLRRRIRAAHLAAAANGQTTQMGLEAGQRP